MKNKFAIAFLSFLTIISSLFSEVFAESVFEFFEIKEPLTSKVIVQTVLPKGFKPELNANFSDNRQNPLYFDFSAETENGKFYYSSPEVFVTTVQKRKLTAFKSNFFGDFPEKDFQNIDNYVLKFFPENARNIKKIREIFFSSDIREYLSSDWYKYIETTGYKADPYSSKTVLEKADVIPFAAIYSYSLNGQLFEKFIFTDISTADFIFSYTTLSDKIDTEVKKLVRTDGTFACDYLPENRDKAFENFVVFVSNTNIPFRVQSALEAITKQKYMNDKLAEEEKLKGIPSEWFVRFYENELPFTSEENRQINRNTLLINAFCKLEKYRYGSRLKLFEKNFFVPEKYSYVYLKKGKTFTISEEKTKRAGKKLRK